MASASSMPSPDQRQDLTSLLECSICLETFDDPRTLQCLHSFCKKCLENFVEEKREDELNCPVCRCKFTLDKEGVSGMTRNHFICNMVEVLSLQHQDKSTPCSHCEQPSAGRCETCELFMCEKCLKSHNEYPGFKGHVVLTMKELSQPENQSKIKKNSKCPEHPKKKLKYYCETCDELICRHCMDFDHDKQHKFSPIEKAAKSKRRDLEQNRETLERIIAKSKKEDSDLKEYLESVNHEFFEVERLINERKDDLLYILKDRLCKKTRSMICNKQKVSERKTRNIHAKIEEKGTFLSRIKASADMARSLLENGNDEEIIRSCQSVQENVNNATEKENLTYNLHNGAVMLGSEEIDKMLLDEIKDVIKDKDAEGQRRHSRRGNKKTKDSRTVRHLERMSCEFARNFNPRTGKWETEDAQARRLEFDPTTGKIVVDKRNNHTDSDVAIAIGIAKQGFVCGPVD